MTSNPLTPQATAAFNVRFDEIQSEISKSILEIKQELNARGIIPSSITIQQIIQRIDRGFAEMTRAASESAKLAYEVGNHDFSIALERELLDAFEDNFSSAFKRLCDIRTNEIQTIQSMLLNTQMVEDDKYLQIAKNAQIQSQLELRQFFQTLKRKQKRWFEHIPLAANILGLFKIT